MKVNTVLFDLDGTLINTNDIILESFKHTFSVHVPELEFDVELFKSFIGPSLQQTFSNYVEDEKIDAMIESYLSHYRANEFDYFEIYPNVYEVISELKRRGYKLGIVTTKFKKAAWPSFSHYKLDELFDVFVALDHVENPKPSREPIDVALSQVEHTGAIMIGDNQHDIMAGQNAGIYSCGVAWSFKGREYLEAVNPDFMLDNMTDLLSILDELNA